MILERFDQYSESFNVSAYAPQAISGCHYHYHESCWFNYDGSGQLPEFWFRIHIVVLTNVLCWLLNLPDTTLLIGPAVATNWLYQVKVIKYILGLNKWVSTIHIGGSVVIKGDFNDHVGKNGDWRLCGWKNQREDSILSFVVFNLAMAGL